MIVDTNILLYARNAADPRNARIAAWLEDALTGPIRVGMPWATLTGFVRIASHPRMTALPLSSAEAWAQVDAWLDAPATWIPMETEQHAKVMRGLIERYGVAGPLISDTHLAALAIEHGVELVSTDGDFARFSEIRWKNPLAEA
jgi:toxin-antitoxin system PIN domain toxin